MTSMPSIVQAVLGKLITAAGQYLWTKAGVTPIESRQDLVRPRNEASLVSSISLVRTSIASCHHCPISVPQTAFFSLMDQAVFSRTSRTSVDSPSTSSLNTADGFPISTKPPDQAERKGVVFSLPDVENTALYHYKPNHPHYLLERHNRDSA